LFSAIIYGEIKTVDVRCHAGLQPSRTASPKHRLFDIALHLKRFRSRWYFWY